MKRKTSILTLVGAALLLAASLVAPVVAQQFTTIAVLNGSATAPSLTFYNDNDTGFFRGAANQIDVATNGVSRGSFGNSGLNMVHVRAATVTADAGPTTLTQADCGRTIVSTRTSTTAEFVLPKATTAGAGCLFRFVTTSAASEVLLTPDAADNFQIKATGDGGASVVTVAGTGIKNTAATNVLGDAMSTVSDGVLTYIMISQSGIWASR